MFTIQSLKQIQNVSVWLTSCAEPEADPCVSVCICVCVCVCGRGLGETLTAERYDATATGENGITRWYKQTWGERSAWIMCRFNEDSRDCNALMSLHDHLAREWSRARVSSRHPQLLRPSSAAGLRRSVAVFVCTHRDSWGTAHHAACRPARSSGGTRTRGWSRTGPNRSWAERTRAATCSTSATERT